MNIQALNDTPPWEWPDEAAEIIKKALKDKNTPENDRVLASELAGDEVVMNDEVADLLLTLIADENEVEDLRCNAAISLGPALEYAYIMEFDNPDDIVLSEKAFHKVEKGLEEIYNNDGVSDTVRRHVLEGAVRSPQDWQVERIKEAYARDDKDWKLTAVFGMGHIEGFEKEIMESLDSDVPEIHLEAIYAAGRQEIADSWPHVKAILENKKSERDLLIAAINVSASINPEECQMILDEYCDSPNEEIADAAEEAFHLAEVLQAEFGDEEDDEE